MRKTFKYRLYPNKAQQQIIDDTLEHCRRLYNRLLAERMESYRQFGHSTSWIDQQNSLPARKDAIPALSSIHSQVLQDVTRRLHKTYNAFFRRVKLGQETPGFPRFKSFGRYHSFTYTQSGFALQGNTLHLSKIGGVKVKLHRPVFGTIKTCTIIVKNGRYYVCFSCEAEPTILPWSDRAVGVDVGVKHFAITSDGRFFDSPKYLRKSERKLKKKQRQVAKSKQGSQRRKKRVRELARIHEHIANQRRDYAHKVSRYLVNTYGVIAFEKLNIAGMLKNHHLAKSIADAGWNQLINVTIAKAEDAGRHVILVNPKHTSQDCSTPGCSYRKTDLTLKDRMWQCPECHVIHDRDINAAHNILARALAS